eukprot:351454-Chlamydomonas_euryale.AAC.2
MSRVQYAHVARERAAATVASWRSSMQAGWHAVVARERVLEYRCSRRVYATVRRWDAQTRQRL